jgi:WXG100 family type VII secretion target
MSGTFYVNTDEMDSTASTLASEADNLASELNKWTASVQNLLDTGFKTQTASQTFGDQWHQFTQSAHNVVAGLQGYGKFLKGAAQGTADFDGQLSSALSKH